jgi:hypothetical protein
VVAAPQALRRANAVARNNYTTAATMGSRVRTANPDDEMRRVSLPNGKHVAVKR